jgi:hypothetical protein
MATKPKARGPTKQEKKKAPEEEKSQRKRFIEAAREVGVDESGKEFEATFNKILPARPVGKPRGPR